MRMQIEYRFIEWFDSTVRVELLVTNIDDFGFSDMFIIKSSSIEKKSFPRKLLTWNRLKELKWTSVCLADEEDLKFKQLRWATTLLTDSYDDYDKVIDLLNSIYKQFTKKSKPMPYVTVTRIRLFEKFLREKLGNRTYQKP